MGQTTSRTISAAIFCFVSLVAFSCGLSAWLTTASLSSQIWPGDINDRVVNVLGGSLTQDVTGEIVSLLSPGSVAWRLTLLLFTLAVVLYRTERRSAQNNMLSRALQQSAWLFFGSSAWWLLWEIGPLMGPSLQRFCAASLPLWLTTTVGLLFWIWLSPMVPSPPGPVTCRATLVLLAVLGLGWTATSIWMNYCLYEHVLIPHGDSAMYEEHLWNIRHGKGFRSYLDQGLFLGEHIQVIHLMLLPLHMIWPSHLCLEVVESVALASCCLPIYLIARRHLGSSVAAAMFSVAWLFYFPMHFLDIAIDQKTFRPIALGVPFIFWMVEFAERRALVRAGLSLLLALSAKEDIALVLCPLLAVLAWRCLQRSKSEGSPEKVAASRTTARWLAGGSFLTAVYLLLAVLVIIPAFRSGDHVHYARYFGDLGGTPAELLRTAITDPRRVISAGLDLQTVLYIGVFLAPLGFVPLRQPVLLMAGGLTFGMLSLLELGDGSLPPVPYHHFHAPLLPIIFWAGIVAAGQPGRQQQAHREKSVLRVSLLVVFCSVSTSAVGSLMPAGVTFWSSQSPFGYPQAYLPVDARQQQRGRYAEQVTQIIPATARVASTDYIHTRLTHCERSYDYSDYLRAVNNYEPGVPADTDYIVIDTGHRYSNVRSSEDVRELREAPHEWELLPDSTDGMFIILRRRGTERDAN